jgi:membrane associated rhomboid family serine protease
VGVGALTGLVAGVLGAVFMILYTTVINPGFEAQMKDAIMAQYEAQGMSEEQIEMAMSMAGAFMSPLFMAISQVIYGALGGVVIGLIAGLFMKRESFPTR